MLNRRIKPAAIFCAWFAVAFLTFGPTWSGRNGSGTYTIPNTFTAGNTITAAGHNQNFSDIATEITNSVAADGQTSMTGPLKAANGSVSAPAFTFASDSDTGLYRIGANNLGLALGGLKVVDYASTGVTVTGSLDATTVKQGTYTLVPAGTVLMYAGSSLPDGYLTGNGSAISRTTYATLFANISTTYGVGDGSTTFNLPDCTGRVLAGKESSATRLTSAGSGVDGGTLGATGGAQTYTIAQANLPNVNLSAASLTASPTVGGIAAQAFSGTVATTNGANAAIDVGSSGSRGSISIAMGGNVPLGGSGTALNTVQPTIVLSCIIKF